MKTFLKVFLCVGVSISSPVFAQDSDKLPKRTSQEKRDNQTSPKQILEPTITAPVSWGVTPGATDDTGTAPSEWACVLNSGQRVADPQVMLKATDSRDILWEYVVLPGPDMGVYITHKNKAIKDGGVANIGKSFWRVTKCINGKAGNLRHAKGYTALKNFNDGTLAIDASGHQDHCVVSQNTVPSGTRSFPCEPGFALHHDTKECIKYGSGAGTSASHKPKGKWNPSHNTNKWERITGPGQDYYRKKTNHNKRVNLTCTRGTDVKDAVYKADHLGVVDWCLVTTSGTSQVVKPMACDAPWYSLMKN